jgi:predicted RNA binding protein YcfA (HicA-like mRNA interferase family)
MSFRKAGSERVVVVPRHRATLKKGTLSGILRDAGISVERSVELLRS